MDNQINNSNILPVTVTILAGETCASIMNKWLEALPQESQQSVSEKLNNLISIIKNTTPVSVENQNFSNDLIGLTNKIISPLNLDQKNYDLYFNMLNLCVVGLGTRIKILLNERN